MVCGVRVMAQHLVMVSGVRLYLVQSMCAGVRVYGVAFRV
jgi:hypothetical protein